MNMSNKQTGFTLIEMMIVVAIMAIMSAMLAPTLFNQVSKAEESEDGLRYPPDRKCAEILPFGQLPISNAISGAAGSGNCPLRVWGD